MYKEYLFGIAYFVTSAFFLWRAKYYIALIENSKIIYHIPDLKHIDLEKKKDQLYFVQGLLQNDGQQKYMMIKSVCKDKYSKKGQEKNLNKLLPHFNIGSTTNTRYFKYFKLSDRVDRNENIKVEITQSTKILADCLKQLSHYRVEQKQSFKQYLISFFKSLILKTQISSFVEEYVFGISFGTPVVVLANLKSLHGEVQCQIKCMSLNSQNLINYLKFFRNINLWTGVFFAVIGGISFYVGDLIRKQQNKKKLNERLKANQNQNYDRSISKIIVVPEEDDLCLVCQTNIKSIIVQPCMHYVQCYECYTNLPEKNGHKTCVYCRASIVNIIRVVEQ